MLALAGKVSSDVQEVVRKRPQLFAQLLRQLKDAPEHAVSPVGHGTSHMDALQTSPVEQAVPQAPQFAASLVRSTQVTSGQARGWEAALVEE